MKTRILGILWCVMVLCGTSASAQDLSYTWAKGIRGTTFVDAYSVAVDASGNVYTTGRLFGTADFDPGAGVFNLTSAGGTDIFISKLDAAGNFVWAKSIGSANDENALYIAVDANNVYLTGSFTGTVDFDPNAGVANVTSISTSSDIFVSKLSASGNFTWAKSMGNTTGSGSIGYSVAVDATGNVYTTGEFQSTVDFDPGVGTANLTAAGANDIFISKLDASGNYVWAKAMGGAAGEKGNSIAVDAVGNVYTTGNFEGAGDFNPDAGIANLTSTGGFDIFISKLDISGNFVWAKAINGTGNNDESLSVAVDATGNVFTTGSFNGVSDFDPSGSIFNLANIAAGTAFISKLDVGGNFVWAKAMGGSNCYATSIALDATGNVYTTGYFQFTVDFDPNAGIVNLTAVGVVDTFISKLDAGGNYVWAKSIGGTNQIRALSIAVSTTNNVHIAGFFLTTVDFDPNACAANLTSTIGDIFVAKYTQCPTATITNTTLAGGIIGNTYSQTLTQTGLTGTPTWSVCVGTLPAGLSLAPTTGIISGTPTATGTTTFVVSVSNGTCSTAKSLSIIVTCPTIAITPAFTTTQNYTVGTAVNITLGASGAGSATYTYAVTSGSLPAGTALASGVISGTPTTAAISGTFTVTATSSIGACTGTQVYNYAVACPALIFTNITASGATVGTLYTLNASVTGNTQPVVYGISPALSAGLGLNITTGVISGTPTAPATSTTYTVTATQGTCSLTQTYAFAVACTGISITTATLPNGTIGVAYNQTITQTGLTGTPVWSVSAGALPTGLTIAGGTGIVSGTLGATGSFTFTIQATSSGCSATQSYTVVVACPVITFTNTTASGGVINTPYTLNAGATGNNSPLTYSVTPALPAGLSINTATGVISGTPTALTTSATYTVMADQSAGICIKTQTYTFSVTNCVPFALSPNKNFLPDGFVNVPYVGATISVANPVAGVTYKFFKRNAINWQEGLTLNENTGVISGTPRFSTSINVAIEAVNQTTGCGSTLTTYTLVIYGDPATAIDNSLENIVKVSPNPSSGDFNIDFGTINMAKSSVRVYDAQGKVVFTSENNTSASGNLMVISLEKFANGIYLMEVETSKGRILKRLAKQ